MRPIYNYHTHTTRCGHAFGSDEDYVRTAIRAGFKVLGFSDHAPFRTVSNKRSRMDWDEFDGYVADLKILQEKYKDQIRILIGLESEYYPIYHEERLELKQKLDFMILGQHNINLTGSSYFRLNTEEEIIDYAKDICTALDTGMFLYLAHPDVIMTRQEDFTPACEEAAHLIGKKCAETHTPVEINVHGLIRGRQIFPRGECYFYPHREFWKILAQYPVKALIGIDAHDPDQLLDTASIDLALADLDDLGLDILTEPIL